jgi:hypothetical protein
LKDRPASWPCLNDERLEGDPLNRGRDQHSAGRQSAPNSDR